MITNEAYRQYMLSVHRMSNEELIEELEYLITLCIDDENKNYNGIMLHKEIMDRVDVLWVNKNDAMNSPLRFAYHSFLTMVEEILTAIEMTAISGAMRYSFSHEAHMVYSERAIVELR